MLLYSMGMDSLFVNSLVCGLVSFVVSGMYENEVVRVIEDRGPLHTGWSWIMEESVEWVVWMS